MIKRKKLIGGKLSGVSRQARDVTKDSKVVVNVSCTRKLKNREKMSEIPEKQAKRVEEKEESDEDEGLPEYAQAGGKLTKEQIEERRKIDEELNEITVSELTEKEKDELLSTDDKYMMSMILETGELGGAGPEFTDLDFTSSITKEEKDSKFSKFTKTLLAREFEVNRQRMNALVSKRFS